MRKMREISGRTRLAGLIGANTANSLSPKIHNFLASCLGVDMVYTCFDVAPNGLKDAVFGAYAMGMAGLNITAPYKIAVMPHLDRLDTSAISTKAVNLLKYGNSGYTGYNTDIDGVLGALTHFHVEGISSATILGNGGAAKAAKAALEWLGCGDITILHRQPLTHNGDLLINATSATPSELAATIPLCQLEKFGCIFDMNYPEKNPWLDQANRAGIKTFDGKTMLVFQAVRAFEILWDVNVSYETANEILSNII